MYIYILFKFNCLLVLTIFCTFLKKKKLLKKDASSSYVVLFQCNEIHIYSVSQADYLDR